MAMADVTVMGAGIFGLAVACACAARGARVLVCDPLGPGAGASGGLVGALAPHVPENWNATKALQFDALRMAGEYWARMGQLSGVDPGYARLGRVQPLAPDAVARAISRAEGAENLWQGFASWRVVPAAQAPGLALFSPSDQVVFDDLSARLAPRRAVAALAGALRALGGRIQLGDSPEAQTPVIWATGWQGLMALGADLGRVMGGGEKGQAVLMRFNAPDAPQVFADGLHIVPHADGTVAIGSTSERSFDAPDTTDTRCDDLIARALDACPDLRGAPVLERWAGVRPRAATRAPLLGPWPGRKGHFVFNGGYKIGFAMAPLLADIMADLVLMGINQVPAAFALQEPSDGINDRP
jgi:glycine oxidase